MKIRSLNIVLVVLVAAGASVRAETQQQLIQRNAVRTSVGQADAARLKAPPSDVAVEIAAGVPLHVKVTRTAHLHVGAAVTGVLTEPIFVRDRLVLPAGSEIRGTVTAYTPIEHIAREQAILNGDVTPLHDPVVEFTSVHLPAENVDVRLDSRATVRATKLVRFNPAKQPSLARQVAAAAKGRLHGACEEIFGPGKKDRALRLLYAQLPYHPQRIWAGTQFIADLNAPAEVSLPTVPPVAISMVESLNGVRVDARLAESLDSKTARKGDAVMALVTEPVFDSAHRLMLPEGTEVDGLVSSSRPARSFGRNGQLRFAIRGVKETDEMSKRRKEAVYGTLTGAEGNAGQNLSVDSEGNVKANPDKDRFVAPLLLAVTAMAGAHHDRDDGDGGGGVGSTTVASNGFGLVARVIALTVNNRNVALGFGAYAFAKSIYFRFLIPGHEVTFPKDTQVEVTLSTR